MRKKIELALSHWGRFVVQKAYWIVLATFVLSAGLGSQLQYFRLDTSLESYFHENDPVLIQYEAFRDVFGRDGTVMVALTPRGGVFEADFLDTLRVIHEEFEAEVPYLKEVTSLVNVRETVGNEEGLEVNDFLEVWPETEEALREAESRALANPLYQNFVISKDSRTATIILNVEAYKEDVNEDILTGFGEDEETESGPGAEPVLTSGEDDKVILKAINSVLDRHRSEDFKVHVAGVSVLNAGMSTLMEGDMMLFGGVSIGLIAFFLAVLFRRAAAVLLPIITVVLSVLMTLSIMAITDTPLMPASQSIPSLLLAVGIGGAVHLLTIFYQSRRRGDGKAAAIEYSLAHSGLPIIMTSLTTAGGLLSFMPAALAPISHFGWVTPIGVSISLLLTLTFLPAVLAIIPVRTADAKKEDSLSQRLLVATGVFSIRHRSLVLCAWAALLVVSFVGVQRLTLGNDIVKWLPVEDELRLSTEFINHELGGAASIELLIQAGHENAIHEPDLLRRIDAVHDLTEGFGYGGLSADRAVSIVGVVKETHRALNENREDFYTIPNSRALVSQELLLFENSGSDDVEDLVTSQFDLARVSTKIPFVDSSYYLPFMDAYLEEVKKAIGPEYGLVLTGTIPLLARSMTAALDTMVKSYAMALVVITLLMIALIGSWRIGLLAMIPNLAPVVFALGLMGWLDINVDMINLMLGSIVIGLAVDDTIHFMHNFRREFEATGDATTAVANTLRGTGQALLFTSFVLGSGFLIYTQAYLDMLFNFGLLTAMAIGVAFLADVTLAPALVGLVKWDEQRGEGPGSV